MVPDSENNFPWINPIGGLGDTLMLSGVLKQVIELFPEKRFRMVRRPGYLSLLNGHPAIIGVGFPRPEDTILRVDYWSEQAYLKNQRAMQILGKMFGLDHVEERFFVQGDDQPDPLLNTVPWGKKSVILAPGSMSLRKEWSLAKWDQVSQWLRGQGCFVLQMGNARQPHVRGAYSISGLTSPKQVFPFLRRADLIITIDCYLMHAAHHVLLPAVVLWGPTESRMYGYPEQTHLEPPGTCEKADGCIGPGKGKNYAQPCPQGDAHCVDRITVEQTIQAVENVFAKK